MKFDTIDEYLYYAINLKHVKSINPFNVINKVKNADIEEVFRKCNMMKKEGKLNKKIIVKCTLCSNILGIFDKASDMPQNVNCKACGESNMEVDETMIKIAYEVVKE